MLAAAKMDDSLANGEKKWNCPTARNDNNCPGGRQETDIFEWMNDSDIAFSNHGGQANDRSFYEEVSGYQTNAFVACIHKHIADHGYRKIHTSNTQIGHRQGKDEPVCCCL